MIHVITGLIALYAAWRLVWLQHWPTALKWTAGTVLVLVAEHHLVTRTFFGSMASPEIPAPLLMVLGWAFGGLMLTGALLLALDLTGLLAGRLSRPAGHMLLTRPGPRLAIAVAAWLLAAVGVWQAVRVPDVRRIEIGLAHLPPELDGFRLVQLTDLHASRLLQRPWMEAVVSRTNDLKPDLIVITGDLADGTVAARHNDIEPLRGLRAMHGVYAIPGNHEYYTEYRPWFEHFNRLGLHMLPNTHANIRHRGAELVLAGITDPAAVRQGQAMPDLRAALAGVPREAVVILLSHRPPGAEANAAAGADLQLSGHTHGGQILGLHWLTQLANSGYVSGLYQVDGMPLYVSNGTGLWNGFPVRLGRPSEITEITLRAPGKPRT